MANILFSLSIKEAKVSHTQRSEFPLTNKIYTQTIMSPNVTLIVSNKHKLLEKLWKGIDQANLLNQHLPIQKGAPYRSSDIEYTFEVS